jgi:hypothetical protein
LAISFRSPYVSKLPFTITRFDSDPDHGSLTLQKEVAAAGVAGLPLCEIPLVLVRLDHVASVIVNADLSIM